MNIQVMEYILRVKIARGASNNCGYMSAAYRENFGQSKISQFGFKIFSQ